MRFAHTPQGICVKLTNKHNSVAQGTLPKELEVVNSTQKPLLELEYLLRA